MPLFVVTSFNGAEHHAIDFVEDRRVPRERLKEQVARIPVTDRMVKGFGLSGIITLYEAGKLQ